jgi:hypothetical protein
MPLKPWIHLGREFNVLPSEWDHKIMMGFVYCITNTQNGKKYIGKKQFWSSKSKQIKGKKKKFKAESDWKTYCGSSEAVQKDLAKYGEAAFDREILYLCKTKSEESYWETYEIFSRHVLLKPERYYNEWVSCKIRRSHLTHELAKQAKPPETISHK